MKDYVVVVNCDENRVIEIGESPAVTLENVSVVASIVSEFWRNLSGQYPPPVYDIMSGRAESLQAFREVLGKFEGWDEATINHLPIAEESNAALELGMTWSISKNFWHRS